MSLTLRSQQKTLAEISLLPKIPDVQQHAWEKQSNIPAIKGALHSQGADSGVVESVPTSEGWIRMGSESSVAPPCSAGPRFSEKSDLWGPALQLFTTLGQRQNACGSAYQHSIPKVQTTSPNDCHQRPEKVGNLATLGALFNIRPSHEKNMYPQVGLRHCRGKRFEGGKGPGGRGDLMRVVSPMRGHPNL